MAQTAIIFRNKQIKTEYAVTTVRPTEVTTVGNYHRSETGGAESGSIYKPKGNVKCSRD